MDARVRDQHRRYQGSRFLAVYEGSRKKLALRLGVSRQAIDRHANGAAAAISYEQLAIAAQDPDANPEAVVIGAAQMIETVRAEAAGDTLTIASRLDEWMARAQAYDGHEDCKQMDVKGVVASLAFMADHLTVAFRQKASAILEAWITCKERELDADLASLGYARALRNRLQPVSEEGAA